MSPSPEHNVNRSDPEGFFQAVTAALIKTLMAACLRGQHPSTAGWRKVLTVSVSPTSSSESLCVKYESRDSYLQRARGERRRSALPNCSHEPDLSIFVLSGLKTLPRTEK